ncbi:hypothetical protein J6590_048779 [Homalodisca vitripennis]|nr:hypothetical protein J6590_048779 [Homalodisca vitripennis]
MELAVTRTFDVDMPYGLADRNDDWPGDSGNKLTFLSCYKPAANNAWFFDCPTPWTIAHDGGSARKIALKPYFRRRKNRRKRLSELTESEVNIDHCSTSTDAVDATEACSETEVIVRQITRLSHTPEEVLSSTADFLSERVLTLVRVHLGCPRAYRKGEVVSYLCYQQGKAAGSCESSERTARDRGDPAVVARQSREVYVSECLCPRLRTSVFNTVSL